MTMIIIRRKTLFIDVVFYTIRLLTVTSTISFIVMMVMLINVIVYVIVQFVSTRVLGP